MYRSRGPSFLKGMLFALLLENDKAMIRKLKSGQFRIYSRKLDAKTHKRKNLGTFGTMEEAKKHEREIQYFKHH